MKNLINEKMQEVYTYFLFLFCVLEVESVDVYKQLV